ncbi:glycosyltransferase family 2 protein [Microbulbifer guangxiensis]|uniref:glycosyltransferase family 2 protein n=1 Tax=Microbulbifer guangxiensis TaxID=2904249 RepID=UPI001F44AE23|nr:glycosyltransferase family 2 protein [Microbulbifer guangxiensis]
MKQVAQRQSPVAGTLVGIITYNPDLTVLQLLLERVSGGNSDVLVYDNASKNVKSIVTLCGGVPGCSVVSGEENIGISGAANAIFETAASESKEFVLLFDQDSIPEVGYSEILVAAYRKLRRQGVNVAALGGLQTCRFTNYDQPFVQFGKWRARKILPERCGDPIPADFLITSGTLISTQSLKKIGGYDSQLFIDNVDVEWCSRAIALSYRIFGVPGAKFTHTVGENRATFFGVQLAKQHSPARTFYIYRNILILSQRAYVSTAWKINATVRAFLKMLFLAFFDRARIAHLKAIFAAVRHERLKKTLTEVRSQAVVEL